ncbi:hypothetical protein [Chryseobacterium hispalense]|uniref:hypothetical protein n=1 Tax=Chryseobacterium hispalense TaxID=1453492 RepID=UPI0004932271|nr:hypothetical protein [Chryseobacterium hispalense]
MKLAIIIEGVQNSGKTSTILHFVNQYQNRTLKQLRAGWQNLFINASVFSTLRIIPYIISSSPSESGVELGQRFQNYKGLPDILILAEQLNGKHQLDTEAFLINNGYNIIKHQINNINGSSDWERFDKSNKLVKLTNRSNEIMLDITSFIKNNNII